MIKCRERVYPLRGLEGKHPFDKILKLEIVVFRMPGLAQPSSTWSTGLHSQNVVQRPSIQRLLQAILGIVIEKVEEFLRFWTLPDHRVWWKS